MRYYYYKNMVDRFDHVKSNSSSLNMSSTSEERLPFLSELILTKSLLFKLKISISNFFGGIDLDWVPPIYHR